MPSGFVPVPVELDENKLTDAAFAYLMANLPGWVPSDGHVETWLIQTFARLALIRARIDAQVPTAIFRYFGKSLLGFPAIDPAPATAATTWTLIDDAGYTIKAGTVVAFRIAGDQLVPFIVDADVVVPQGITVTPGGAVTIRAIEAGTGGNGLSGPVELVDTLAYVDSITTASTSSGGVAGETDLEYLDRLVEELQLLAPRPILPGDFAVMARRVPGVHRALAIDGYDPGDASTGNERMVTVAVVDADGATLTGGVKSAVDALLQSEREINFVVHVIDPTFTNIAVTFTATTKPGYDPVAVKAAAEAAVRRYLSPGRWAGGDERVPTWHAKTKVRYLEVAQVINQTVGLDEIDALALNAGTADITLTGIAPLPNPTTIVGTVT